MARKTLTQEQVNSLKTGDRVLVKWSGGNGPWEYRIVVDRGQVCTDMGGRLEPITFVGSEQPYTQVWRKFNGA